MIANLIARLKCWRYGHQRGRRMSEVTFTSTTPLNHFECPRCKATWTRKVKAV